MDLAKALDDFHHGRERDLAQWALLLYAYGHPRRHELSPELRLAADLAHRQGMLDPEILGTTREDWT